MLTCCQSSTLQTLHGDDSCLTSACNDDRFSRLQRSSDPTGKSLVLNVGRLGVDIFINFSQRPQSAVARCCPARITLLQMGGVGRRGTRGWGWGGGLLLHWL